MSFSLNVLLGFSSAEAFILYFLHIPTFALDPNGIVVSNSNLFAEDGWHAVGVQQPFDVGQCTERKFGRLKKVDRSTPA
jgi:hypothetical protein